MVNDLFDHAENKEIEEKLAYLVKYARTDFRTGIVASLNEQWQQKHTLTPRQVEVVKDCYVKTKKWYVEKR